MAQYILLLHEDPASFADVSPSDMEAIIEKYMSWRHELAAKGLFAAGHKLQDGTGRVIRAGVVSDGPYTEAKEVIGGLFIINAASYDEALSIARTCPHCDYGTVEIRQIEDLGD